MKIRVAYGDPHTALVNDLYPAIEKADRVRIAVGFVSPAGLKLLEAALERNPQKVQDIVIGSAGFKALSAVGRLMKKLPSDRVFVHLGWATHNRSRGMFRPMLHSKIYYTEARGRVLAFVGSNNLTEYALGGANCEASIVLEGSSDDAEIQDLVKHLDRVKSEAVRFDPKKVDLYARWFQNQIKQLIDVPPPHDPFPDHTKTLVILSEYRHGNMPRGGDVLYFEHQENPSLFEVAQEVHLYLFPQGMLLQGVVRGALSRALLLQGTLVKTGLTGKRGVSGTPSAEPNVQWVIRDVSSPVIERAPPCGIDDSRVKKEMQIKIQISHGNPLEKRYVYSDGSYVRQLPLYETGEEGLTIGSLLAEQRRFEDSLRLRILEPWKEALEKRWLLVTDLKRPEEGQIVRPDIFGVGPVEEHFERDKYTFYSPKRREVS